MHLVTKLHAVYTVNTRSPLSLQNEVNAIKWDPTGNLLASCSDDMTLKVSRELNLLKYRTSVVYVTLTADCDLRVLSHEDSNDVFMMPGES